MVCPDDTVDDPGIARYLAVDLFSLTGRKIFSLGGY